MEKLASIRASKQRTSYHVYTMTMKMSITDVETSQVDGHENISNTKERERERERAVIPSVEVLDWCDDLNVSMLGKFMETKVLFCLPPSLFSSNCKAFS